MYAALSTRKVPLFTPATMMAAMRAMSDAAGRHVAPDAPYVRMLFRIFRASVVSEDRRKQFVAIGFIAQLATADIKSGPLNFNLP